MVFKIFPLVIPLLCVARPALAGQSASVPAYFCPMKCEGEKAYAKTGRCPVCFMDLVPVLPAASPGFSVRLAPAVPGLGSGRAVELVATILDPKGEVVREFDIAHEKPVHLIAVSHDLSWYEHAHPRLLSAGGWAAEVTFPTPGSYELFYDIAPKGALPQVLRASLQVPGQAPPRAVLAPDVEAVKAIGHDRVSLRLSGAIAAGREARLAYTITRDGASVAHQLEPYLGAQGHLVAISEDLASFVHGHPAQAAGDAMSFDVHFPKPGLYRAWVQFRLAGSLFTVPYTLRVEEPGPQDDSKSKSSHEGHGH